MKKVKEHKSILVIGANGFIGKNIAKAIIKNFNFSELILLDLNLNNWRNFNNNTNKKIKFLKCNVADLKKYKKFIASINIILDCIGSTGHNFKETKLITHDLNTNFLDKISFIEYLKYQKNKLLYISLGSLFKYGSKKKIGNRRVFKLSKGKDFQILNKYLFENYLYSLTKSRNYLKVVNCNMGNVYGYSNSKNYGMVNELIISFINNAEIEYYVKNKKIRYKNIIYIDDLVLKLLKEIEKNKSISKKSIYLEKNYFGELINVNRLVKFLSSIFPKVKIKYTQKKYLQIPYYFNKKRKINNISKQKILKTIEYYISLN